MITPAELRIVEALGQCWNAFLALPVEHDDDRREFRALIHHAQEKVLARSTLRQLDTVGGIEASESELKRVLAPS